MAERNSKIPTFIKQNNTNRPPKRCREGSAQSENGESLDLHGLAESHNCLREQLKSMITKEDLSNMIEEITERVFCKIKDGFDLELKMIEKRLDNKLENVLSENHNLKQENEELKNQIQTLSGDVRICARQANEAIRIGNYNEQYSRKSNLKFFNINHDGKEPLAEKMCRIIEDVSNGDVVLDKSEIVAVHPIPSPSSNKPKPIIMKVRNSEVKSRIMRCRKNFFEANIPVFHDVTKMNLELIKRLKSESYVSSAWFYNCFVYAKTSDRKRVRIDLFDDYEDKIKTAPKEN